MKLTVGMAAFREFEQVWFTVQALRVYQDLSDTEILVLDNHGDDRLKRFCDNWTNGTARYVRWTEVQGSAPAKGRVFAEARGEYVAVIDPHVLLWPGAVAKLRAWLDAHPEHRDDLLHGPLVYDNLTGVCDQLKGGFGGDGVWGSWHAADVALDAPAYEIERMGMGCFGARRESWLGFAAGMRGFGAEEGFLHAKYRRSGRRVMQLPFLRWVHLFRDGSAPYPLRLDDKIRNSILAARDAGVDEKIVTDHFGEPARRIAAELVRDIYSEAATAPSDMVEHVPALSALAAGRRVAEFGVRAGVSTVALLHGKPASLSSYDLNPCPREGAIRDYAAKLGVPWTFHRGDSRQVEIPEVDVLMVDTIHEGAHLRAELDRHAGKVRERIVLHDTETNGERGCDGGEGLMPVVRDYAAAGWVVESHDPRCHGLTVLRRA